MCAKRVARRRGARRRVLPRWDDDRAAIPARAGGGLMSGFSAEWLALREPYDQAARSRSVLDAVRAALCPACRGVRVTDLGCGTGSTLRAVAPLLPAHQHWRLDRP